MSLRWAPRNEAKKLARKERGLYECAMCHELFRDHQVHLDHVLPVIDIRDGFVDWNTFIERLFPFEEGWQVLCTICHDAKTRCEDTMRSHFNSQRKEIIKKKKKAIHE